MKKIPSLFRRGSNGGLKNLNNSYGCIKTGADFLSFGANGYLNFYLDDKSSEEEIEKCRSHIMKVLKSTGFLNLPNDCGIAISLIDEAYINPNSNNLVITSIAEGKALFFAKPDDYSDMEALLDEVHNALMNLSDGKKATVDWQAYAV
tara:strand:+ start:699 stop:1142 length:444 start_codon:yes stop_codon:yes gene_type:complete